MVICSTGTERKDAYKQVYFIFLDIPSWVCIAFPEGALRNICLFFQPICDYLQKTPTELARAWLQGYLDAQGGAINLEAFCAVEPPEEEAIYVSDIAQAMLSLVNPLDSLFPVNELQRKIGVAVTRDRWFTYCKCKPPPPPDYPDPPGVPDPLDPNPLIPPIPTPDGVTVITTQIYYTQNPLTAHTIEKCFRLDGSGWTYCQTIWGLAGSNKYVIYNTNYTKDFAYFQDRDSSQSFRSGYYDNSDPTDAIEEFEPSGFIANPSVTAGSSAPNIYQGFNHDVVQPSQVFYLDAPLLAGSSRRVDFFYRREFPDGSSGYFLQRAVNVPCFESVWMAASYPCGEIPRYLPFPEPPYDPCTDNPAAAELAGIVCEPPPPPITCFLYNVEVSLLDDQSNPYTTLWKYADGECETEQVGVDLAIGCDAPIQINFELNIEPI